MNDILILADDLSGAADCASACLRAGRSPLVLIDPHGDPGGADVIAVDVDSRARTPRDAGAAMAAQVERRLGPDTRMLYQKMDSTLRGHWARETACVLEAMATVRGHRALAIMAPAFPAAGRTLVAGRSLLNGAALEATEIWAREGSTRPAAPAAWLAGEGLRVGQATLDDVRRGPERLSAVFSQAGAAGIDAVVCDAQTDADLDVIAGTALSLAPRPLWVGSAGLMRAFAGGGAGGGGAPTRPHAGPAGPVLIAVGSASQVSREQVRALVAQRAVTAIGVAPSALRAGTAPGALGSAAAGIAGALSAGRDVAVTIDGSEGVDLRGGAQLAGALADLVAPWVAHAGGLIATGGETARAILTRCGVPGLRIRAEVEPGVPLSSALGPSGLSVVTKAGAFGDASTLVRSIDAIRGGL